MKAQGFLISVWRFGLRSFGFQVLRFRYSWAISMSDWALSWCSSTAQHNDVFLAQISMFFYFTGFLGGWWREENIFSFLGTEGSLLG